MTYYHYQTQDDSTDTVDLVCCFCPCHAVNATASNVTPAAQYLTQNGAVVTVNSQPVLLFQPVVQVWGYYAQDLSAGPTAAAAAATTSSATRRLRQTYGDVEYLASDSSASAEGYVNKYFFVPAGNASKNTFTVASGDLLEGYYRVSAKVSVLTVLPNLVELQGIAAINQVSCCTVTCTYAMHHQYCSYLLLLPACQPQY